MLRVLLFWVRSARKSRHRKATIFWWTVSHQRIVECGNDRFMTEPHPRKAAWCHRRVRTPQELAAEGPWGQSLGPCERSCACTSRWGRWWNCLAQWKFHPWTRCCRAPPTSPLSIHKNQSDTKIQTTRSWPASLQIDLSLPSQLCFE